MALRARQDLDEETHEVSDSAYNHQNHHGNGEGTGEVQENKYVDLLMRIRNFFHNYPSSHNPSGGRSTRSTLDNNARIHTTEILAHFEDVPNEDAAIFKSLLKGEAVCENGFWRIKYETRKC